MEISIEQQKKKNPPHSFVKAPVALQGMEASQGEPTSLPPCLSSNMFWR